MPLAFVLINTESGTEDKVIQELRKIRGIIEVHTLYGMHDIIVKVNIEDRPDKLKEDLIWKIRRINEVQCTTTLLVADSHIVAEEK
ncbi:MAG: Lrp/AsnC ligand binding domain-containing protein [Candidatus Methanomethylicaceae archaeon]|jgi:DNA-binding Lrp family transcriptional regulator